MRKIKIVSLLLVIAFVLGLGGCKGGNGTKTNRAKATVTIGFSAMVHKQSPKFATVIATVNDIVTATVDIMNGSVVLVQGASLADNNGVWSATINDLPVGEQLTIIGHAYNGSGIEVFTGTTYQTLSGVDDEVVIAMDAVSNGETLQFPTVTQISRPTVVLASGAAPVSISIQGSENETLSYEITAAPNGGSFSPSSNSITLNGTSATLVIDYTADATIGNFIHTLRVTNSLGNYVETTFDTNVAAQIGHDGMSMRFSPVITSLSAARSGSDVTVTATVSDTGPSNELVYNWSFAGNEGFSFLDASVNPAVLQGSSSLFFGTLTLTVANGSGGSTTVSYKFAFPKVSSVMLLPQVKTTTGIEDCRGGSVSGNIVALRMEEGGNHQDYNNDGDQNDDVLGYYNLTQQAVVNTGVTIGRNVAIDGDIMAFQLGGYGGTVGFYSISTQTTHDTGITPDRFGADTRGPSRLVSNGKIVFTAAIRDLDGDELFDSELHVYDTASLTNTPTGMRNILWNNLSISGNIVAFTDSATGHIQYYDITTGITVDTLVTGDKPIIGDGTILFRDSSSGKLAYYDIANENYAITPLPGNNAYASISNGIIVAAVHEGGEWGDLNGSGILGDDDSGILVMYDIPTGRMVSTGLKVCCGSDISNDIVNFEMYEPEIDEDLDGDGEINDCVQVYFRISDVAKQYFGRPVS